MSWLLLPIITLTGFILALMLVIAFARNLALTCGLSIAGLIATLVSIIWVNLTLPLGNVTPLIIIDPFALLFSGMMVIAATFICLLSYAYKVNEGPYQDEFYLLLLLSTLGAMVLTQSSHFASFILGLELLSVAIYAMISYPKQGLYSLEAGLKYLILSGVSSAFILFGIALIYTVTGQLGFTAIENNSPKGSDLYFILMGSALLLSGIGFKLSLVPFHMWTPDVYEGAPAPVTAFLATVSKGAIFAALVRFFMTANSYQYETIMQGLFWVAFISILFGNLLALMQSSIKRMLAYSSIAHFGYLLVAFIGAGEIGGRSLSLEASSIFLIAYFITTIGAFGVVTIMSQDHTSTDDHDRDKLEDYAGLFWHRPLLAAFFSIMLLSLAGIPLTAGFIGKFYILAIGVESQLWGLLFAVVVGSGIGLFYYLRVIFTMTKRSTKTLSISIPITGGWAMMAVTIVLLILGVYPTPVIEWVSVMAQTM